jgi:hypothetical protein
MRRRAEKAKRSEPAAEPQAPVVSRMKPQLAAHLALGLTSMGFALAHATPSARPTTGGALSIVFFASAIFGGYTALAYFLIPSALARIERVAALPEDFALARKELLDRLFREVSGKSELVKKIFEKILLPYTNAIHGPLALIASRRSLREEERAVRARIEGVLDGRGAERLAGLNELVRIVVELRSLPAQKWLLRALRAGLPAHIVTFAIAAALLILHIITATRYRQ